MFWQLTPGTANMDPWGHVVDETLGTGSAVRIQSAYDAVTGRMTAHTVGSGGTLANLQNMSYQWDPNTNLSVRQDHIQGLTEAFSYDSLNRLQSSSLNGVQNLSVSIDSTGNITSRTEGGVTYAYTYDPTHVHAVDTVGTGSTQTSYTYDANGNMATRNSASLTWASYNLPTSILGGGGVSSAFNYGPDRLRKQQVAQYVSDGGTGVETTVYVFWLFESEVTSYQQHNKYFVYTPGGTRILYDIPSRACPTATYITADHLGSGSLFLHNGGSVILSQSFAAYGSRRSSDWSGPLSPTSSDYTTIAGATRRGYTDAFHEFLDNLNLIHMNGRVYDPAIGRFLSPDPLPGDLSQSQSWNPYAYVMNRPLTATDPTGFAAVDENRDGDDGEGDFGGGDLGGGDFGGGFSGSSGAASGPSSTGVAHDTLWEFASFGQQTMCDGACISAPAPGAGGSSGGAANGSNGSTASPTTASSGASGSSPAGSLPQQNLAQIVISGQVPHGVDPSFAAVFDHVLAYGPDPGEERINPVLCHLTGDCRPHPETPLGPSIAGVAAIATVPLLIPDSLFAGAAGLTFRFSQLTASPFFSAEGIFAGQSIADVAAALRAGTLLPPDVPVQFITIDGTNLIINTRSSLALMQAGIRTSEWATVDMTGDAATQALINQRLLSNGLSSLGTDVLRITGSGGRASTLIPGP